MRETATKAQAQTAQRVFGYLRVSTADQDLEKFKTDILHFANEKQLGSVEWIEEKVSGVQDWRKRKIGEILTNAHAGDTIITPELSRLGRSTLQILEIMREAKQRGVSVHAVKGGWSLNGSMESKIFLQVMAMVSEIERDLISARTKEALQARKAQGVKLGRPKGPGKSKLDRFKPEIIALLNNGSRMNFVAARYECKPGTLHNWLKKNQIKINAQP